MNLASMPLLAVVALMPALALAQGGPSETRPGASTPVTITNTPLPVTVGGGVNVTGSVTVGNTDANPVPVYGEVEVADAKAPFMQQIVCQNNGNTNFCRAEFTVPAGRRLVIEFVGVECSNGFSSGLSDYPTPMLASLRASAIAFGLNVPSSGTVFNSARRYTFSQPVLLHAPAASEVQFQLNTSAIASVQCVGGVSGYTVPSS